MKPCPNCGATENRSWSIDAVIGIRDDDHPRPTAYLACNECSETLEFIQDVDVIGAMLNASVNLENLLRVVCDAAIISPFKSNRIGQRKTKETRYLLGIMNEYDEEVSKEAHDAIEALYEKWEKEGF